MIEIYQSCVRYLWVLLVMLELYDFGLSLWMNALTLETESVLIQHVTSNVNKAKQKA